MFLLLFFVQIIFKLLEGLELIPHGCVTSKSDIWGVPERRGCHGGHSTRSCGESEDEAGSVVHSFSTSAQEAEAGKH